MITGIFSYESFVFSFFKSRPTVCVNAPYSGVCDAVTVDLFMGKSAILFEMCVELVQCSACHFAQRNFAYLRNNLLVYSCFVGGLCMLLEGGLHVVLIPNIHPRTELHIRRYRFLFRADFRFQGNQFFLTFGSGFTENVLCFREPFYVITDDYSAFPSAVLSLSYSAIARFSFLILAHIFPPFLSPKAPKASVPFRRCRL